MHNPLSCSYSSMFAEGVQVACGLFVCCFFSSNSPLCLFPSRPSSSSSSASLIDLRTANMSHCSAQGHTARAWSMCQDDTHTYIQDMRVSGFVNMCAYVYIQVMHLSSTRPYGSVYEGKEGTNPARTVDTAQMLGHTRAHTNAQRNTCTLTHTYAHTLHNVWCCLSGNEAGVGRRLVCLPLPYARGVTQLTGEMTESHPRPHTHAHTRMYAHTHAHTQQH